MRLGRPPANGIAKTTAERKAESVAKHKINGRTRQLSIFVTPDFVFKLSELEIYFGESRSNVFELLVNQAFNRIPPIEGFMSHEEAEYFALCQADEIYQSTLKHAMGACNATP
jgi:hypothetical protein